MKITFKKYPDIERLGHEDNKDILKEEFTTIFDKYKFIDFKEMKQAVPKQCLRVITSMMQEQLEGTKDGSK
jgi:hypothetical protein